MYSRGFVGAQQSEQRPNRGTVNQIRRKNRADPKVLLLVRLTILLLIFTEATGGRPIK